MDGEGSIDGEGSMDAEVDRSFVTGLLRRAGELSWTMQDIGLLGLWLDDRREVRLHVWGPGRGDKDPPVHDHPFDFTSTVIAGELTDTVYRADPGGDEYVRFRYPPGEEDRRRADAVRLSASATTYPEGAGYRHGTAELHSSRQLPGTVTVIRCAFVPVPELTVCHRDAGSWCPGRSRPATPGEVEAFTTAALGWF